MYPYRGRGDTLSEREKEEEDEERTTPTRNLTRSSDLYIN